MRLETCVRSLLLAVLALFSLAAAAKVELNPSAPETYRVREGDTLWDIAARFLREPWRWPEIWEANREIGDPDRIFPGDVLRLYYRDGEPRIGVERGMRTVKLSPRVRATALEMAVPVIPIGSIRPFLSRPYVLEREAIERAPYIVDFPDEHVIAGLRDSVYVRAIAAGAGERFDIVRPGEPFRDPDNGAILGYKAVFVADAQLERAGDPARLRIVSTSLEAGIGDRVIAASEEEPFTSFMPRPGPDGLRGRIISVLNGVSQIGQFNVVVLNRGADDGLTAGHVLEVFNGGEAVRDNARAAADDWNWRNKGFFSQDLWYGDFRVQGWASEDAVPALPPRVKARRIGSTFNLPYEKAGTLMVFRTFPRVSFAIVMNATRAMHVLDTVVPPEA